MTSEIEGLEYPIPDWFYRMFVLHPPGSFSEKQALLAIGYAASFAIIYCIESGLRWLNDRIEDDYAEKILNEARMR